MADESYFKISIYTALAEFDPLSVHVGLTKRVTFSHDPNNAEDPPLAGKDAHNLKIGRNKNVENVEEKHWHSCVTSNQALNPYINDGIGRVF
ncbi:hypothetical protein BOTNAR_0005g00320 [Botryotinia narcissicola]|uniref:Uncharacterized protein n=1 Tax=Botryotinia narcissicola TaxID=278944 RepID=A0A4Z1JEL3_9HELO|nr:hypothetical protein BOTNAR_0005g00320 [Botryotinia narcissicola]